MVYIFVDLIYWILLGKGKFHLNCIQLFCELLFYKVFIVYLRIVPI